MQVQGQQKGQVHRAWGESECVYFENSKKANFAVWPVGVRDVMSGQTCRQALGFGVQV